MNCRKQILKLKSLFQKTPFIHQSMSTVTTLTPLSSQQLFCQQIDQPLIQGLIRTSKKNPIVICHRGRSDIYPQNTMESILEGLNTSDLVQFDVMLTKDQEVIVFHDRFLGQITNVQTLKEFTDRKTINNLNQFGQIPHSEWWTKEFTLEDIQKLSVKQKHQSRPQITETCFQISTLQKVMQNTLQLKKKIHNNCGILIEIKTQTQNLKICGRDKILIEKIGQILRKYNLDTKQLCCQANFPVIVQSFNHQALKQFHKICPQLPLSHLYYQEDQNVSEAYILNHRTPSSIGIGVSTKHLKREFVEMCHKMEYQIFYWSVIDDHPQIPLGCSSYEEFYLNLKEFQIDGIITDFANNCRNALKLACF